MPDKEFKYQQYLNKYKNCPDSDFIERTLLCFRWVHDVPTDKDFIPVNLHPDFPPRQLDSSDELCKSYGLSMFKDLASSKKRYLEIYGKYSKPTAKERFKREKGDKVVSLQIAKDDGISNDPNKEGHFTFYEYVKRQLLEKIKDKFDIFVQNGNN